jgi:hypothetical protein
MSTTNSNSQIGTVNVNLSAIEVQSLNTTPIRLVPAPGAGYMHIVLSAVFVYNYGTSAYTGPGLGYVYAGNSANFWGNVGNSFLSGTANKISIANISNSLYDMPLTDFENQPINVTSGGNPTGGDGTLTVIVTYVTVKV